MNWTHVARLTCAAAAGVALLAPVSARGAHSIRVPLADGFDLPVGKPDAAGYYVFRGYSPNGHQGEDWNGSGGGNSDLGDPVYATADGVVVFSEDYYRGWGNVVIVRHAYQDTAGQPLMVDSLYGHLNERSVRMYQPVKRGQQVGTIGTAHGKYWAHLHFELRRNLRIGMQRSSYAQDYSNYFSPRRFITPRRRLPAGGTFHVPVDSFAGQGGGLPDDPPPKQPALVRNEPRKDPPGPAAETIRRAIPVRDPKTVAAAEVTARKQRDAQLQRLADENRRKVESMKEEDMDAFWDRLKKKLKK